MDHIVWKYSAITKQVLAEIKEELEKTKEDLSDGALIASPSLEREYCWSSGYAKGLQYIVTLIENIGEESDNESGIKSI